MKGRLFYLSWGGYSVKRFLSVVIVVILMTTPVVALADSPQRGAVYEVYSADGYYEDGLGNTYTYSYHVPQISVETDAALEINNEIFERFGSKVEDQLQYMGKGLSLWMWKVEWQAFWNDTQLFLFITCVEDADITDYAAYGYDFETGERITNGMILEQRGISEEDYLTNLKEKVQFMFEDMYNITSEEMRQRMGYEEMLERTLEWANMDCQMFVNRFGEIETIVRIASVAGAGWYYHLATPFAYG